jgi:hypothetical protein
VELLFVHDAAEAEVGDEEVGVVFGCAEQKVLGLEVAVYYAVVVEVCDGREGCANEVSCVGFEVGALAADAVKQLAAESKVRDKVDCVRVSMGLGILGRFAILRLFIVSK